MHTTIATAAHTRHVLDEHQARGCHQRCGCGPICATLTYRHSRRLTWLAPPATGSRGFPPAAHHGSGSLQVIQRSGARWKTWRSCPPWRSPFSKPPPSLARSSQGAALIFLLSFTITNLIGLFGHHRISDANRSAPKRATRPPSPRTHAADRRPLMAPRLAAAAPTRLLCGFPSSSRLSSSAAPRRLPRSTSRRRLPPTPSSEPPAIVSTGLWVRTGALSGSVGDGDGDGKTRAKRAARAAVVAAGVTGTSAFCSPSSAPLASPPPPSGSP